MTRWLLPFTLFVLAFLAVPVRQMHGFAMIPGDLGDARLNNYFLENIYQFLSGKSDSLWNLGFFYPFPYILGFSDNLYGSSPVYLLARLLIGESDTAFQVWFFGGYAVNFAAAYFAFRRLGGGRLGASVGALVFTFALPTTAHAGHAQLHYRFGVPLATVFFFDFLEKKHLHFLIISGAWLVWQFYCGIYIGFFTLFLLLVATVVHFFYGRYIKKIPFARSLLEFIWQWKKLTVDEKYRFFFLGLTMTATLALLFFPYIQVTRLYGTKRMWDEIALQLPRPQSYFVADASFIWRALSLKILPDLPMRHEHQMFIGVIPMVLAGIGFLIGASRKDYGNVFALMIGSLLGMVGLTLYFGGFSLWYFFHKLPLASAIRAMTRLDLVLLLPVAYFIVIAIDDLRGRWHWITKLFLAASLVLMVLEFSATSMYSSAKNEWRDRAKVSANAITKPLVEDSILFVAQDRGPFYAVELDAMWFSLKRGQKTLNGYSGTYPPGYAVIYGSQCAELPRRVLAYLAFRKQADDINAYRTLMKRIVPVGFIRCDPKWLESPPGFTTANREYAPDEIRKLAYQFGGRYKFDGYEFVNVIISNPLDIPISAKSGINKPIRLSWRFVDLSGNPASGWDNRMSLPFDIPENGTLDVQVPVDTQHETKGGYLEFSVVQEGVFWAHDVGLAPLRVPWD